MRLFLLLLMMTSPTLASASYEIYTWKDESGITHFSQSKPDHQAQVMSLELSPAHKPLPENEIVASSKKSPDDKRKGPLLTEKSNPEIRVE